MAKTLIVAEQAYTKEDALALREQIIQLRDYALKSGQMEWAVVLSLNVALLAVLIEEYWK